MQGLLRALALAGLVLAQLATAPALAQTREGVAILDQRRLFTESQFGQRVTRETQALIEVVVAENNQIEAELEAEERSLAEQRGTMDAQAFRELADAFDAKVTALRQERNQREQQIARRVQDEESRFQDLANELLAALIREEGFRMVMPAGNLVYFDQSLDITARLIARIDAEYGDGALPTAPAD